MMKKTFFAVMVSIGILFSFSIIAQAEAMRVDVTSAEYGADGNDTAEDKTAVFKALDAIAENPDKGTVYFPAGTYYGKGNEIFLNLNNSKYSGITLEFAEGAYLNSNSGTEVHSALEINSQVSGITIKGKVHSVKGRIFFNGTKNLICEDIVTDVNSATGNVFLADCDGITIGDVTAGNKFYVYNSSRNITAQNVNATEIEICAKPSSEYDTVDSSSSSLKDTSAVTTSNINIKSLNATGKCVFIHNIKGVTVGSITSKNSANQGMRAEKLLDCNLGNINIGNTTGNNVAVQIQNVRGVTFGDITTAKTGFGITVFFNSGTREDVTFGNLDIGGYNGWNVGKNIKIGNIDYIGTGDINFAFDSAEIGNIDAENANVKLNIPKLKVGNITASGSGKAVYIGAKDSLTAGEITSAKDVFITASNANIEKVYANNGKIELRNSLTIPSSITATTAKNWRIGTLQSDNSANGHAIYLYSIKNVLVENAVINYPNRSKKTDVQRSLWIDGACEDIVIVNYKVTTDDAQVRSLEISGRSNDKAGSNFLVQNGTFIHSYTSAPSNGGTAVQTGNNGYEPKNVKFFMTYTNPKDSANMLTYYYRPNPTWQPVPVFEITDVAKESDGTYTAIVKNVNQVYCAGNFTPIIAAYNNDTLAANYIGNSVSEFMPFDASGGETGTSKITFTPSDFNNIPEGSVFKVFLWKMDSLTPIAPASEEKTL